MIFVKNDAKRQIMNILKNNTPHKNYTTCRGPYVCVTMVHNTRLYNPRRADYIDSRD